MSGRHSPGYVAPEPAAAPEQWAAALVEPEALVEPPAMVQPEPVGPGAGFAELGFGEYGFVELDLVEPVAAGTAAPDSYAPEWNFAELVSGQPSPQPSVAQPVESTFVGSAFASDQVPESESIRVNLPAPPPLMV